MDQIIQWILGLLTQAEWRAIAWLLMVTLAGTHTLKVLWRLSPWPGGSHGHVHLMSAAVAFTASFFVWPAGLVPWWIAGIVGGPASNIAFKAGFALLKRFTPDLAATVNMDRRKVWGLPPKDRQPWRKDDPQ